MNSTQTVSSWNWYMWANSLMTWTKLKTVILLLNQLMLRRSWTHIWGSTTQIWDSKMQVTSLHTWLIKFMRNWNLFMYHRRVKRRSMQRSKVMMNGKSQVSTLSLFRRIRKKSLSRVSLGIFLVGYMRIKLTLQVLRPLVLRESHSLSSILRSLKTTQQPLRIAFLNHSKMIQWETIYTKEERWQPQERRRLVNFLTFCVLWLRDSSG